MNTRYGISKWGGTQPTGLATILASGPGQMPSIVEAMGDVVQPQDGPRTGAKIMAVDQWAWFSDPKKVAFLRRMVSECAADPRMRWFVVNNVLKPSGVEPRDYPRQCAALLRYVQEHIYYANEDGEQVQTPWRTLSAGTGDCDDSAVLLATMAAAIDLPCRFVLAGKRGGRGKLVRWVEGTPFPSGLRAFHIYCELGTPASKAAVWYPAEPTVKGAPLGYDIVLHGLNVDRWGRPFVPPSHGGPAVDDIPGYMPVRGGAKPQFYGALGETVMGDEETFFSTRFWQGMAMRLFEGAVGAVVTVVALEAFDRYRRRRK